MANFKSSTSRTRRDARLTPGRVFALAEEIGRRGGGRVRLDALGRREWEELVAFLGHEDPKLRFAAGTVLTARGEASWPLLLDAMRRGTAATRRSALHVVGRIKVSPRRDGERRRLLLEGLRDEDDKVRKNAAVALGALDATTREGALADEIGRALVAAHRGEERSWVRASLLLALGRCASDVARAHVRDHLPRDDDEAEALRTVRRGGRDEEREPITLRWSGSLVVEVRGHGGLGDELGRRIERVGLPLRERLGEERFLVEATGGPELLWRLRSMREWRVPLGRIGRRGDDRLPEDLVAALGGGETLRRLAERLGTTSARTGFRVSVEGSAGKGPRRSWVRPFSRRIEEILPSWENAPGNYDVELCVGIGARELRVDLRPGGAMDPRFPHRGEALPASLQCSVAAGLVGLLEPRPDWNVLDPCCGAGTLLLEMAAAGVAGRLVGVDRSADAIARARKNFASAGRAASFVEGDLGRVAVPGSFQAVVANLPFGIRVSDHGANETLYRKLFDRLGTWLVPGGKAMVLSQEIELLEGMLRRTSARLEATDRHRIAMGGLTPMALVLRRRS